MFICKCVVWHLVRYRYVFVWKSNYYCLNKMSLYSLQVFYRMINSLMNILYKKNVNIYYFLCILSVTYEKYYASCMARLNVIRKKSLNVDVPIDSNEISAISLELCLLLMNFRNVLSMLVLL